MKQTFVVLLLFLLSGKALFAYELVPTVVERPYAVVPMHEYLDEKYVYMGELAGFPIMYGVDVRATTTLTLSLTQQYRGGAAPTLFGVMIVRVLPDDQGVAEVARFNPLADSWSYRKDTVLGLKLLDSTVFTKEIGPGTYRIEVNTAVNEGRYLLSIGEEHQTLGYFDTLNRVRTTQAFFGYTVFKLLNSSIVYYPLGIILLLLLIQRTWRYRHQITHA